MPWPINTHIMVEICDTNDCTGCGACYNACPRVAISMQHDDEGFLRPVIDAGLCIDCHLCTRVCPANNPVTKHERVGKPIAAIAADMATVKRSSSGGMFSTIAEHIFADGGVVYGVVMDEGNVAHHTVARNIDELAPMRSSKYMQSDTRQTYRSVKQDLKRGVPVLYTGTPCQIAGLLNYLGNTDRSRLVTADVVCHGTPSAKMYISYLHKLADYRHIQYENIKDFNFRQTDTWDIVPVFYLNGDKITLQRAENLYMRLFLSGRLHRPCCYHCPYATTGRISDITIADFWGIGEKMAFHYDTKAGCSLVLPNSDKGKELFAQISGKLHYEYRSWEEALKYNHQLHPPSRQPRDRATAIKAVLGSDSIERVNYIMFNSPAKLLQRIIRKILRKLHFIH